MKYSEKLIAIQQMHDDWAAEFEGQIDEDYLDGLTEDDEQMSQAPEHALEVAGSPEAEEAYYQRLSELF